MDQSYAFLRVAVLLTKILSFISAGLGIIGALVILFGNTPGTGKLASLGALLMGGVYFLGLYLLSDLIRLLLALENRLGRIESALDQPQPRRDIR